MSWARAGMSLAAMAALMRPPKPRGTALDFLHQPTSLDDMRLTVGLLAAMEPDETPQGSLGNRVTETFSVNMRRLDAAEAKRQRRRERNLRREPKP